MLPHRFAAERLSPSARERVPLTGRDQGASMNGTPAPNVTGPTMTLRVTELLSQSEETNGQTPLALDPITPVVILPAAPASSSTAAALLPGDNDAAHDAVLSTWTSSHGEIKKAARGNTTAGLVARRRPLTLASGMRMPVLQARSVDSLLEERKDLPQRR
jgi:hypothetical protein